MLALVQRCLDHCRGVARRGPGVPVTPPPPLGRPSFEQTPTIFRWRKRHDNILAVKAIFEKPTFLKFLFFSVKYFCQRLLSLVNMGLPAIIRLNPLIHEGEQRYKQNIVGDPWTTIW